VTSLNICLLNAGFDTGLKSSELLLGRYWHVPKLAEALADLGHQVTVIQAFHQDEELQRGKVAIKFVAAESGERKEWAEITRIEDVTRRLELRQPDVMHFLGLTMLPLRRALGDWCTERGVGLTASFHGGRPSRNLFGRWRQRRSLTKTSAFFFPSASSAMQWRSSCLVPDNAEIVLAPEVSSPFSGLQKQVAIEKLGVGGGPVFAWSGRLNSNKDPITTLKGIQRIVQSWPTTQLLMAYQSEEVLPDVLAVLEGDSALKGSVRLLGALEHADMETLFSAADFFVHSSHREWGSNSLVEAMSCGAIPVVSDIPSLRALTEQVEPAILFDVGDADGLARQVLELEKHELGGLSHQVKSAFNAHLSYPALAASYSAVFERLASAQMPSSKP